MSLSKADTRPVNSQVIPERVHLYIFHSHQGSDIAPENQPNCFDFLIQTLPAVPSSLGFGDPKE